MNPRLQRVQHLAQKIRGKLPSRNWSIFLGTTTVLLTIGYRDRRLKQQELYQITEQCTKYSREPLQPHESPRKLKVYVAPTEEEVSLSAVRHQFQEFVKPVLDAAAIDYEVIESSSTDSSTIANSVKTWIHRGKRTQLILNLHEKIEAHEKSRTLWQRLLGRNQLVITKQEETLLKVDPVVFLVDELKNGRWNQDTGLVAVGDVALRGVVDGLKQGLETEPNLVFGVEDNENKDVVQSIGNGASNDADSGNDTKKEDNANTELQDSTSQSPIISQSTSQSTQQSQSNTPSTTQPTTEHVYPTEPTQITLPPIGYIPLKVYVGFSQFPFRLYWFLHSRILMKEIGNKTLNIVDGNTCPVGETDVVEKVEMDSQLKDRIRVYS